MPKHSLDLNMSSSSRAISISIGAPQICDVQLSFDCVFGLHHYPLDGENSQKWTIVGSNSCDPDQHVYHGTTNSWCILAKVCFATAIGSAERKEGGGKGAMFKCNTMVPLEGFRMARSVSRYTSPLASSCLTTTWVIKSPKANQNQPMDS